MKSNPTKIRTAISPTRLENYPEWYQAVVKASDLAENSPTRGCMIIKPLGFAIWENIQNQLDVRFKLLGHKNVYFPLLIPLRFMQAEAEHIEGFAKECAVVTHHRLEKNEEGKLIPAGELEEPYIIRPTSETIIGDAFSRWIQSYRDLPVLINQWANIMRWEMRTRLFLRTAEFLWQEGHTAHATSEEAYAHTHRMLGEYAQFAKTLLAMPVIQGEKSASERFPGAEHTYTIEAMMQDGKALQAGTSHFLGQHFSKAFNIQFLNKEGSQEFAWTTSWGVTTRLIGALIMTHSDDDGLVLPPRIAPTHVVMIPVIHKIEDESSILDYCQNIAEALRAQVFHGKNIIVEIDKREMGGGEKKWDAIKKGTPIRIEIGARELQAQTICVARRDQGANKQIVNWKNYSDNIISELDAMQNHLYEMALKRQQENTVHLHSKEDIYDYFSKEANGFATIYYDDNPEVENALKSDLSVTVRCFPLDNQTRGNCVFSQKPNAKLAILAKAY